MKIKKLTAKDSFTVTIEAMAYNSYRDEKLADLGSTLKMDGFRQGHVPSDVIKNKYESSIRGDFLKDKLDKAVDQIINENDFDIYKYPTVKLGKIAEDKDISFDLKFFIWPEITVDKQEIENLEITQYAVKQDSVAVDNYLAKLSDDFAEQKKGVSKEGDIVILDFIGEVDGKPNAEASSKGYAVKLGSKSLLPEMETALYKKNKADKFKVNLTFPEKYDEKFAKKKATFSCEIKDILCPAKVDDKLAAKLGFKSCDILRQKVVDLLKNEYRDLSFMLQKRELFNTIENQYKDKFKIPASVLKEEEKIVQKGLPKGKKSEITKYAKRRIIIARFLMAIAKINKITLQDSEIEKFLNEEKIRNKSEMSIEEMKENPQIMRNVTATIMEDKTVKHLLGITKIIKKEISLEEIMKKVKQKQ